MVCRSKFCLEWPKVFLGEAASALRPLFALLICTLALGLAGCAKPWHPLAISSDSDSILGAMRRHEISGDETLLDLTRRYDLGYVELVAANQGVDPWLPGVGTEIILPTAHLTPSGPQVGIVINLAEQRLYAFPPALPEGAPKPAHRRIPKTFPIGVSRDGWSTPIGTTRVVRKRKHPIWYPTKSALDDDPTLERAVGPGPENPLGDFALYLGWPTYLIHGTNEPDGVGRRVSRGCIRLYPEDIEQLFGVTPVETSVRVINEPVKLARAGRHVYLEVHPTLEDVATLEEKARLERIRPEDLRPRIREFAGEDAARIDWLLAFRTAAERRGIPIQITR